MPHPVPIIIGTTIAVAATGYAFKKFVYDPHLAPVIEGFIEQQKHRLHRRRARYEAIPVAVDSNQDKDDVGAPASGASGRSTTVDYPASGHAHKRRPAEFYELDESRVLPTDRDRDEIMMEEVKHKPVTVHQASTPRVHRRKPVPELHEEPPTPVQKASTPETLSSLSLLSMEDEKHAMPGPTATAPFMENPFADSVRGSTRPPSPVASPAPSHTTLIEHPSPTPSFSVSTASNLDVDVNDLDIISVPGTANSYIDAESYTPRSLSPNPQSGPNSRPISPPVTLGMLASEMSFPFPQADGSILGSGSELTMPRPNAVPVGSGRSSPNLPTRITSRDSRDESLALSVSSWTEDEWHGHTDSEWDAVSDAPSSH